MNTQDNKMVDKESDKVMDLFTPKYPRKNNFSFSNPQSKKKLRNRILWTIGSVAAMLVVVLAVAMNSVVPASAKEVVSKALGNISEAKSVKVEFEWRGKKTSAKEIYSPDLSGNIITGTLYLMRKDGKVYARIDWHDTEKNSIIFNGDEYIHQRDGKTIGRLASSFGDELMNLVNLRALQDKFPDILSDSQITMEEDVITVKSNKDMITFCGEFSRENNRLIKAYVSAYTPDNKDVTLLKTISIQTNIPISEEMFSE